MSKSSKPTFKFTDVTPPSGTDKERAAALKEAIYQAKRYEIGLGRPVEWMAAVDSFPILALRLHERRWTDIQIGKLIAGDFQAPDPGMREIFIETADDPLPVNEINPVLKHWGIKMLTVATGCDSGVTIVGPLSMTQNQAQAYWDSVSDQE